MHTLPPRNAHPCKGRRSPRTFCDPPEDAVPRRIGIPPTHVTSGSAEMVAADIAASTRPSTCTDGRPDPRTSSGALCVLGTTNRSASPPLQPDRLSSHSRGVVRIDPAAGPPGGWMHGRRVPRRRLRSTSAFLQGDLSVPRHSDTEGTLCRNPDRSSGRSRNPARLGARRARRHLHGHAPKAGAAGDDRGDGARSRQTSSTGRGSRRPPTLPPRRAYLDSHSSRRSRTPTAEPNPPRQPLAPPPPRGRWSRPKQTPLHGRRLTVGVCRVHFLRNVFAQVPKGSAEMVAAAIRTVFVQPDAQHVTD